MAAARAALPTPLMPPDAWHAAWSMPLPSLSLPRGGRRRGARGRSRHPAAATARQLNLAAPARRPGRRSPRGRRRHGVHLPPPRAATAAARPPGSRR